MKSVLNVHWKDWCRSWNSNTLATWFEQLTHWKGPWCWARLKAGGEGDDSGWMASLMQWTSEFEQTSGVGDGQGGLACCGPWSCKESAQLSNWAELNWILPNDKNVAKRINSDIATLEVHEKRRWEGGLNILNLFYRRKTIDIEHIFIKQRTVVHTFLWR